MTGGEVDTEATPIQVVLEVPDSETLLAVLDAVSDADAPVRTANIAPAAVSAESSVTVDLGVLTDKQREAVDLALRQGYYERPREADLAALASRLGISKSAVSQRLRAAERKLIRSALGRYR